MTRRGTVEAMLKRYGRTVRVQGPDGAFSEVRALIQPLNYRNKQYPDDCYLDAGYFDNSHYLYLGPAEPCPKAVAEGETAYTVRRARQAAIGGVPLYLWAVLQAAPEEEFT